MFGTQPSNTLAGGVITPAVTVRITDAGGNLVTTDTRDVTVAIGTNPAAGTLGGTQTVAAVGGVATFSTLTIDNPGTGYTLVASASGLTGATSVPFNITTTPPPSANLVVNGGFESGTSPVEVLPQRHGQCLQRGDHGTGSRRCLQGQDRPGEHDRDEQPALSDGV